MGPMGVGVSCDFGSSVPKKKCPRGGGGGGGGFFLKEAALLILLCCARGWWWVDGKLQRRVSSALPELQATRHVHRPSIYRLREASV